MTKDKAKRRKHKLTWLEKHPGYNRLYMRAWRRGEKFSMSKCKTVTILNIAVRWRYLP